MKKFIKFLEDNNAWENFERAFRNYDMNVKGYKNLYNKDPKKALVGAFGWENTKEGISYWDKLNDKWLGKIKQLKDQLLSDD
nr:MAG: hypothetical protein [Bacteriophage sp.]